MSTTTAIRSPLLALAPLRAPAPTPEAPTSGAASASRFSALDWVLADQQTLTAVDRFAHKHESDALPPQGRFYRDLLPGRTPTVGEQYAFEVDLDLCTGCKACVTGCHSLNGLDEGEVWRTVGLLHGGTAQAPAQQSVTTACHHCLEPACLSGCPVKAYEKNPVTGIVKHLDDQCIGCQYCVFMCPYDAPKYSKSRGIVRKCDMCSDRLEHGEAPACVQSCPNEAIRIAVVDRADAIQATDANAFLPGAPGPGDTLPTTVYKTERALPRNMLPADFYSVSREHAHPPLVAMLGLTQLSVGAFVMSLLAHAIIGRQVDDSGGGRTLEITNALFALALGMAALGASTLHLGRPRYAFRALLGLRTSWLSREILTFGLFAALATAFAGSFFVARASAGLRAGVGGAAAATGVLGVFCSVMVYAATRRRHWRAAVTGFKFALSTLLLGSATVLMVSLISSVAQPGQVTATVTAPVTAVGDVAGAAPLFVTSGAYRLVMWLLLGAGGLKLGFELAQLRHLRDPRHSIEKRTALLLARDLGRFTLARFACGVAGAIALPAVGLLLIDHDRAAGAAFPLQPLAVLSALAFGLCLAGELLERFLFFAAAPASRMPGGVS